MRCPVVYRGRPQHLQLVVIIRAVELERIDPALVPEMMWRDVASRPPIASGRVGEGYSPTRLIAQLAFYDLEVAAAIFEPIRLQMEHADPSELAGWRYEFMAWSLFDPRAAVSRLEETPISSDLKLIWRSARVFVAESLGRQFEERWGAIWPERSTMPCSR